MADRCHRGRVIPPSLGLQAPALDATQYQLIESSMREGTSASRIPSGGNAPERAVADAQQVLDQVVEGHPNAVFGNAVGCRRGVIPRKRRAILARLKITIYIHTQRITPAAF